MSLVNDVALAGLQLNVVPGTYRKRNKRIGGRPATFQRITIDRFRGQRMAFADDAAEQAGFAWDGLSVGPAFDGQGVEPFPNVGSHADGVLADTPSVTVRGHAAIAGNNAFIGLGRRIYKSVALSNGSWANFTAAADLGVGFVISGLAYFQDDLLVLLSSGQEIRKFNTVSNGLTIWRTGERGVVGVGYAGQLIYAPRQANNQEELRLSGTRWNGNAVTHLRYLDSPIITMCLFNGQVAIATKSSLYFMGGQPYPGEADDATVTADTSKAAEWIGDPEPIMTHGQFAAGDDFTFLASYRGHLYTWLQGRVAEFDGVNEEWRRMGPEGVRCFGGSVAGDWLCVAIQSRYGGNHELWGFNGEGWWKLLERASPAIVWPLPLAGAGNRELLAFRDASLTYDLARFNWRSASVHTYATSGEWLSPLLEGGAPGAVKPWSEFGATFAMPDNRGNSASVDSLTISLDYSIDGGATFVSADSETTTAATSRTFTLRSNLAAAVEARYLQLRVTWSSVSDWAPVLSSAWAEYEIPESFPPRRRVWQFDVAASDRNVSRDGSKDPQDGDAKSRALWELWAGGHELVFTETDGGLWSPAELGGRALWLAADRLSGLQEGDPLASWPDPSGSGLAPAQATPANQPNYHVNVLNGLPVVRFDGGDWLILPGFDAPQPFSQFAVWKPSAAGQALMFSASGAGLLVTDFDDDVGLFSGSVLFDFDHHPFNAWHLVSGTHNGVSSSVTVDGGAPTTGSAGAVAMSGNLAIGAGINGGDRWLNGDIAELVITRTALSVAERQRLEGYAAWKYGLVANLPGGHPYKLAAPLVGPLVRIESIEEKVSRPGDAHRWGEAEIALVLEEV